ncbi:DNA-directed RNA polymerases II and IV subunit 5A [Vigna radiata var. radiata]|uniref:DNA-directed RNA polymerases II and IV subunit 5A n=1 Tax=Vigna radiata var. radiata TaxID=3916 RepID=A0A3Q0F7S3_VIGRR|nr:DNA-directed RNA polymerases II and IV subunit 5A [Vigna radiata var. radiata]
MVFSEEEVSRLFRIRKTVMQMLRDRGYLVEDFEINVSKHEFKSKYGERKDLFIHKSKKDNSNDRIYVFFPNEATFNVGILNIYYNFMASTKVWRAILVTQMSLNHYFRKCINGLSSIFYLEVFQEAELLVNIKEHILPEHQILPEAEKKTLVEKYTVKEIQIPRVQVTDPVARYYGLKRGQVVKIIRPNLQYFIMVDDY